MKQRAQSIAALALRTHIAKKLIAIERLSKDISIRRLSPLQISQPVYRKPSRRINTRVQYCR